MTGVTVAQGPLAGTVVNGAETRYLQLVQNTDNSGTIIAPHLGNLADGRRDLGQQLG